MSEMVPSIFSHGNIEKVHVMMFTAFPLPAFIEKNALLEGWRALRVNYIPL